MKIILKIWLYIGTKILPFNHIDIYSPNNEDITGVTFSTSEEYINKISEIE